MTTTTDTTGETLIARTMAASLSRPIIEAGDSVITLIRLGFPSSAIREHVAVAEAIAWRASNTAPVTQ